jgi:hypothetical protein
VIFLKFRSKDEERTDNVYTNDCFEGEEGRDTIIRLEAYDPDPE